MNAYDVKTLLDNLDTARIYAGAEFERLCNNNQHIDACVFQSIRDSIAQNIQLLQSYVICKAESDDKSCSNCKYWLLDKNDENRKCRYCFDVDEWVAESER